MFIVIENGELYTPEPRGPAALLLCGDRIVRVGEVQRIAMDKLGVAYDVIDATGCVVLPGLLDPHEHLIGGSGESGYASQTPELRLDEIVGGGITTVVGCLGVDTTLRTMPALLGRAKGLRDEGITAFIYSGGYNVPPTTILGSLREDILMIDEVIGAGEIAIADERATEPSAAEFARLATDAHIGGMLSGKAGVTHIHVGPSQARLAILRSVLDGFDVAPAWLYPTHIERSEALMLEAIELTKRGCTVDIDVVEKDLGQWLPFYFKHGGEPQRVTVSSDASITSPRNLFSQLRECVLKHRMELATVLPTMTRNTASILQLPRKGRLEPGCDADVIVARKASLEIVDVVARGQHMVRDGNVVVREKWCAKSDRQFQVTSHESKFEEG